MPRIYIADLAAYNAGFLVGEWITLNADTDAERVQNRIDSILDLGASTLLRAGVYSGPHEEFAIHDYDDFGPIEIGEYDSIEQVLSWAELLGDDENAEKLGAYIAHAGIHYIDSFDPDNVIGPLGDSMRDVAYDLVHDLGYLDQVPESIRYYFDYDAFARDMEIEGSYVTYNGQIFEIAD